MDYGLGGLPNEEFSMNEGLVWISVSQVHWSTGRFTAVNGSHHSATGIRLQVYGQTPYLHYETWQKTIYGLYTHLSCPNPMLC
ncbi:hypothetical protein TNIN_95621 [Trichonephila inaurata madagascariensis]|uniref:Uncharacterized protein n=1 Tax=Trichonephila inaurata madagascariensis TaxID=2747483 RepID=A0A8X6YWQ0_9ARAC|nr:hypothetical protein TNIN_95621 [Trichonephila inaurata madagascariensis]